MTHTRRSSWPFAAWRVPLDYADNHFFLVSAICSK